MENTSAGFSASPSKSKLRILGLAIRPVKAEFIWEFGYWLGAYRRSKPSHCRYGWVPSYSRGRADGSLRLLRSCRLTKKDGRKIAEAIKKGLV